jgi:hypothetical protein
VSSRRHIPRNVLRPRFRSNHHSIWGMFSNLRRLTGSRKRGISPIQMRALGWEIRAISRRLAGILSGATMCRTPLQTTTEADRSASGSESVRACLTFNPKARRGWTSSSVPFRPITSLSPSCMAPRSNVPSPQPMSTRWSSGVTWSSIRIRRLINSVKVLSVPRPESSRIFIREILHESFWNNLRQTKSQALELGRKDSSLVQRCYLATVHECVRFPSETDDLDRRLKLLFLVLELCGATGSRALSKPILPGRCAQAFLLDGGELQT